MVKQKQPPKPERIQVPAFWISKTQSAFGYEFLANSQMDKNALKGERSLVIRQSLTAGLSLHNLDPKLIDLINGYGKHLTFKTLIALLQMLDPDLQVSPARQEKKVTLSSDHSFTLQELKSFVSVLEAKGETAPDDKQQGLKVESLKDNKSEKSNFVESEEKESVLHSSVQPTRVQDPVNHIGRSDRVGEGAAEQTDASPSNSEDAKELAQKAKKQKFTRSLIQ